MAEPTPEAYEAAMRALSGAATSRGYRLRDEREPLAHAAVDAVWDLAEATVRAKVAAEIRAYAAGCMCIDPSCPYAEAARIAEQGRPS